MVLRAKHIFVNIMRRMYGSKLGRNVLLFLFRFSFVRYAIFGLLENVRTPENRRQFVEAIQSVNLHPENQQKFADEAHKRHKDRPKNLMRLDLAALFALSTGNQNQISSILYSEIASAVVAEDPAATSIAGARISFGHELENYREVLSDARRITNMRPEILRSRLDYLKTSFAAGKVLKTREALEYFGRQYMLFDGHAGEASDREIEKVVEAFSKTTMHTLKEHHDYYELKDGRAPKIGVFFLSSTQALGHAILDPFHFLALNRNRFDKVFFIGPPKSSYAAAPRACLQIVEQYGDYIETHSDTLLNLSWMSLGEHQIGPYTLVIDHYWSLLRSVYHRSVDKSDEFHHNNWHLELPDYFGSIAKSFCAKHKIDLSRPIVTLHARDDAYHAIAPQSFRNSSISTYQQAIKHLLKNGFQVIRLGDKKMPSLDLGGDGYFELPFLDGYSCELDPFFIGNSAFMIGCQSGPCAFARALGIPMLSINAVLHYTLLPTPMEMACFKKYFRIKDGRKTELPLLDALEAGVDHFDNTYHFKKAGIEVGSSSSEEILAATKDMLAWIDKSKLAMTKPQKAFYEKSKRHASSLGKRRENLNTPIADYVGIGLPGYRISPSVSKLRDKGT